MRLTFDVDEKLIQDVQKRLGDLSKKTPSVIANALNRAAMNVNSNIKKEVRKEYVIKAGDIQETLKQTRATSSRLGAEVRSKGNLTGLDKFKVSPKTVNPRRKKPIKVGVKKGGVKEVLGAFVADVNGTKLFERTSKARLPIRRLFGPSVPQMINNEGIREQIYQEGRETFSIRLDHEINRILDRGRSS